MATFRLFVRPAKRVLAKMEFDIPSFAAVLAVQRRYSAPQIPARLPIAHGRISAILEIRSGLPGEVAPAWVDSQMEIVMTGSMQLSSSAGELYQGTYIESLIGGGMTAGLVLKEDVEAGGDVTIYDDFGSILFSGKVVRSNYDEESTLWTVTAMDPLSERGLDEEFQIEAKSDASEVLPFEFDDLSEKTRFPTVPVESGITLRYWISLLESLRGARLTYDPETDRYVLSSKARVWNLNDALSFSETIDPSQYYNAVIAEQDDAWEQAAERKTETLVYGGFTLFTDRAGEKVYLARLSGPTGLITSDAFEYNDINQVIKTVSVKGTKTTTTNYTIQQGENPYVRSEIAITLDSLGETVFSERRINVVNVLTNPDRTILVLITETREWFEKEQVIEYE